jgi:DNA-binding SARP family transcriptional activator
VTQGYARCEGQMRVQLLGAFGVEVGGKRVDPARWRLRKARTVLKLLALEPGQRLHREYLLNLLWPDLPPRAAANNLHQALYVARRALAGEGAEGADGLLELRDHVVVLSADRYDPDNLFRLNQNIQASRA